MTMTTITLQLNASDVAGDWATRSAGNARTRTGLLNNTHREIHTDNEELDLVLKVSELRGIVDSIKEGVYSPNIADTRSSRGNIGWGTPALYRGIRFALAF